MKVLVTGSSGFIGKNLCSQLGNRTGFKILTYGRHSTLQDLREAVSKVDFVCHLAGVNRPDDTAEFGRINTDLTRTLCETVQDSDRHVPIIFASSVHAERDNPYGLSKRAAEQILLEHSDQSGIPVYIFRLPHVIGKWCKPNYNSVIATFCHNIARDLPIHIDDPEYELNLVYIDDLVSTFGQIICGEEMASPFCEVPVVYPTTVGAVAEQLRSFHGSRSTLVTDRVGEGLTRALYSTYISYLPPESFIYGLQHHVDLRGSFVEMLKTRDSGQFSFFTAHPGVTRGGHYHHSKSEKFLVIRGEARFRFRHILSDESYVRTTSGNVPEVVETTPGWVHDVTNIGENELIVMLWANEIFDPDCPDTYTFSLEDE